MKLLFKVFLFLSLYYFAQGKREETLSDHYKVEWEVNPDDDTIEFQVTVETKGFVGFGLSLTGGMPGADMIIGGVNDDGSTYFKDYYGANPENGTPKEDEEKNWDLLEGRESEDGVTTLRFKRKLDTCDPNGEDVAITEGTIKIIWSFGATDGPHYHGTNRGALAVNMLDPAFPPVDLSEFNTTDFVKSITMPEKETTYWCTMFERSAAHKSHIVAFKPKLETPESLAHTHHFNMYTCRAPQDQDAEELFGKFTGDHPGHDCFTNTPGGIPREFCTNALYAWSLGGRLLVFPEDIGFPWGLDETEYFLFEVHLNNPENKKNLTFETGVTFFDTNELRDKEAGMLSIGHSTSPSLIIPPNTKDWKIVGHCSSNCTRRGLESEGINLFNINLHAHISGRQMRLRHFRKGAELPWILNDETYDADFQENRPLSDLVRVEPEDHLSLECTYDSNWKEGEPVIGGFATVDEMCMLFAFYYPRAKLDNCYSGYPDDDVFREVGIEAIGEFVPGTLDPIIVLPEDWAGRTYSDILKNEVAWTPEFKSTLQNKLLQEAHREYCSIADTGIPMFDVGKSLQATVQKRELPMVTYPEVDEEYQETDTCNTSTSTYRNPAAAFLLLALSVSFRDYLG